MYLWRTEQPAPLCTPHFPSRNIRRAALMVTAGYIEYLIPGSPQYLFNLAGRHARRESYIAYPIPKERKRKGRRYLLACTNYTEAEDFCF